MYCNKQSKMIRRLQDGTQFPILYCIESNSQFFTKEVTEQQCTNCPFNKEPEEIPELPSLSKRIATYAKAVTSWVAAGSPERTEEDVNNIFNTYCKKCNWLDAERQVCKGCGCKVNTGGVAIFNKIKMGNQHCPRRLW